MKKNIALFLSLLFVVHLSAQTIPANQFGNSGNVGIGTNNPNYPLEVYGQSKFHGKVGVDSIAVFSDTLIMMETSRVEEDLIVDGNLILTQLKLDGFSDLRPALINEHGHVLTMDDPCSNGQGSVPFWKYGSDIIFVNCPDDVRVGIGTSTPIQTLDVMGNQYIDGNLGIGTSTPESKLDIETTIGQTSIKAARYINSTDGSTPQINELFFVPRLGSGGFNSTSSENDMGIFWNDNSDIGGYRNEYSGLVIGPHTTMVLNPGLKIGSNGFVGIGNKSPSERLEISNGALLISGSNGSSAGTTRFIINDNTNTNNFVEFSNTDGDQFLIDNEGKVYAHEVEVKLGSFPDYVFEDDYNLLSLDKLELFIKTHKHLPEVPDAKTVVEEGLNLGEMDAVLLKKVEELTLYIIEQQKQIEILRGQIESLQTK